MTEFEELLAIAREAMRSPDPGPLDDLDAETRAIPGVGAKWARAEDGTIWFGYTVDPDEEFDLEEAEALSIAGSLLRAVRDARRQKAEASS